MRVIIADDNNEAALHLKKIIEEVCGVSVIGIAKTGREAVKMAELYEPEVIFMDVAMPDMNGIDAARELSKIQPDLYYVFVTAYPDFALKAFELYSFDYILKPFDEKRIKKTVRRLKEKTAKQPLDNLAVRVGNRRVILNLHEILYIEKQLSKILIKTTAGEEYLTFGDLKMLEIKLGPQNFFRCHKGYLVNLKQIREIIASGRTYELLLCSGNKILLSREREKILRQKLYLIE